MAVRDDRIPIEPLKWRIRAELLKRDLQTQRHRLDLQFLSQPGQIPPTSYGRVPEKDLLVVFYELIDLDFTPDVVRKNIDQPFLLNFAPRMARTRNPVHVEEQAEAEVLSSLPDQINDISKRVSALRLRLSAGGKEVRDAVGPVQHNTRQQETVMQNADGIMSRINRLLEPGQDLAREETIIRASHAKARPTDYMASVKRVERMLVYMDNNNIRNEKVIGECHNLISVGRRSLEDLFRSTLLESCKPVEPLFYITKELSFPVMPQEKLSLLAALDKTISSTGARNVALATNPKLNPRESPSIRTYTETRGQYLVSSLQGLSIASISTSKKQNPEHHYRQGTSAVGTYAKAIEGLFLAELQNITAIFPDQDRGTAIEVTTLKALADFSKTLRELNMFINKNLSTDSSLAYEIIQVVTDVAHRLNPETGDVKLKLGETLKPVRETAKTSVLELFEDQRRRISDMQTLPGNGSTSAFTTETMRRMQGLTDYPRSLASILTSIGDGNWAHPSSASQSIDVGADGSQLLSHYILDTVDLHITQLEGRARILYKSKAVHGVFLSNTVATIDKMIRSSDLDTLLANPAAQAKFEAWRKRATSIYMDSWRETSSALFDVQYTSRSGPRPHSGSTVVSAEVVKALGSKDKDAIKEKWKLFNSSFDECVKKHREMSGSMEREVKSSLSREVGNMVEPLYARFWDRYEALDRGRGKYVKYDKGQLAATLASLG